MLSIAPVQRSTFTRGLAVIYDIMPLTNLFSLQDAKLSIDRLIGWSLTGMVLEWASGTALLTGSIGRTFLEEWMIHPYKRTAVI